MKKRNLFLVLLLTLVMCLSACGEEETSSRRKRSRDNDDDEKIEEVQIDKDNNEESEEYEGLVIDPDEVIYETEKEDDDSDGSEKKTFKVSKDLSTDNATVTIDEYYITQDYYDEDEYMICLKMTYTNNSDSDRSFLSHTNMTAYQAGIRLDDTQQEAGLDKDINVQIQPGTTVSFVESFTLRDTTTDVEIKLNVYYNNSYHTYETTCMLGIK